MDTPGLRFKDKVAIVTGGCNGIGKGCVDVLVQNGGKVVIFDIDEKTGKSLNGKCGPGEIYFILCDIRQEEQIKASIQEAVKKYGQIDCLVNNAGYHPPAVTIDELTVEQFNSLVQLNLTAYFMCCKYALPYLRKTKGSIVNISSVSKCGQSNAISYVATKGGISAMTNAIAFDEAKYGVRVNAISPGTTRTPLYERFMEASGNAFEGVKWNLFDRPAEPYEIGQACLFFAVDATYCTAVDLCVSAGLENGGWK